MEIRIGITNSQRELSFETTQSASDVEKLIREALESEKPYFTIGDDKGKVYIVPIAGLAYVEVGSEESRRIGFVA
ncbi:DUF3107 domain-containing protein [Okibacterium endophyticum]